MTSGSFVFAQERTLEVPLPGIGGEPGITTTPFLPDYIKYIFNFTLGIGGLIVFGVLLYSGFNFLTSVGNPSKMADSKDRIFSALLGLVVLLGSWLLLTTINPELIKINPANLPSGLTAGSLPGVYLCKSATSLVSSTDCQLFLESRPELGKLNDQVGYIIFKNPDPPDTTQYGAVLHENPYFKGTCQIYTSDGLVREGKGDDRAIPTGKASSVTLFTQGTVRRGITVYEDKEYGRGYKDFTRQEPDMSPFKYDGCEEGGGFLGIGGRDCSLKNSISSVRVHDGSMAVLFGDKDYGGACAVFFSDISALGPTSVGDDQVSSLKVIPIIK